MKTEHLKQIETAIGAIKGKEIKHIYFVACGGSMAMMYPSQFIIDCESSVPATIYSSNEFIHRCPKSLGPNTILISCSHSGNTPETVGATTLARQNGAITIALSNLEGSPLWDEAEFPVHYEWGEKASAADSRYGILYSLTFGILNVLTPSKKYAEAIGTIETLQPILDKNKALYQDAAASFGENYKKEPLLYTMASGGHYGCAYSFAVCLMMEMQWVHSNSIHSGEYFHGPFEITDHNVPFLIIKGIDQCRPLDERAHTFCKKHSDKITLVDAADFDMSGVPEELQGYFAPFVTDSVLRTYAEELADRRGHPLSVRRYMWRMEY